MTSLDFSIRKKENQKISMVTCYDSTFAKLVNDSNVDCILIGDSCAMVMYGENTTIPATVEMIEAHTRAVRKGAPDKFIVADMPFLATRKGLEYAVECAGRFLKAGANAVKIERISTQDKLVKYIVDSGIPVMAHLGLTPQFYNTLGGHKRQGKTEVEAELIKNEALLAVDCGCFSVVLECIPSEIAEYITKNICIATIGIGSGIKTDGQVLVLQDLLGLSSSSPKFVKKYLDGSMFVKKALDDYANDVSNIMF